MLARCCCLVVLLSAAAASADPPQRPSAADVAKAVAASREANVPTRAEHISDLRRRHKRQVFILAQYEHGIDKPTLLAQRRLVRGLERQILFARKRWEPPAPEDVELYRLVWTELDVGTVGRATKRGAKHTYRCQQILGPDSLLLLVMQRGADLCVVHLANYPTSALQEGLAVDLDADVVVVGRYRYQTVDDVPRDVPALEVFDPDAEFR